MGEDADPQVVEQRSPTLARPRDPRARSATMLTTTLSDVDDRDDDERRSVALGVMPSSMPLLGEQRAGLERERLDDDEHERASHAALRCGAGTGAA